MKKDQIKKNNLINNKFSLWYLVIIIVLIIIILLLLKFCQKPNNTPVQVPTGNIDIFDLKCNLPTCQKCDSCESEEAMSSETIPPTDGIENPEQVPQEPDPETLVEGLNVFDNDITWTTESELRIFTNPALEFQNIIAPGTSNSYVFRVRNNNDFNVEYSIDFIETNLYGINIQYKLKKANTYVFGGNNSWVLPNNINLENISLNARQYDEYVLEWKWIESSNDTQIGIDATANYKLTIEIIGTEV